MLKDEQSVIGENGSPEYLHARVAADGGIARSLMNGGQSAAKSRT